METEKANFPIAWMCRRLPVSRASFYRWRGGPTPSARTRRHEMLVAAVKTTYEETGGRAGRDQLTRLLNQDGVKVSVSTVGQIMRKEQIRAIRTRAFKTTTTQDPQAKTAHIANHMLDGAGKRNFTAKAPGKRLCGDITYLRTGEGWLYLATVIDLHSGMIIGWAMDQHMRASLCTSALEMARDHGFIHRDGAIFHSDRGAQYTSAQFQTWCAGNQITQSMGRTGVCWDNAVAENFFSHLKTEFYHQHTFTTRLAARTGVMEYIESWYNRKRPNARAGHQPPATAQAEYLRSQEPLAA